MKKKSFFDLRDNKKISKCVPRFYDVDCCTWGYGNKWRTIRIKQKVKGQKKNLDWIINIHHRDQPFELLYNGGRQQRDTK
jgi:hypothetical protein